MGKLLHVVAAKRTDSEAAKRNESDTVKTTVELPGDLWRAAKIRSYEQQQHNPAQHG